MRCTTLQHTSTTEVASSGIPEDPGHLVFHVDSAITGLLDSGGVKGEPTVPLRVTGHKGCRLLGEVPTTLACFTKCLSDLLRIQIDMQNHLFTGVILLPISRVSSRVNSGHHWFPDTEQMMSLQE